MEKKAKKLPAIELEIEALLHKRGFQDFAFAILDPKDSRWVSRWVAGDGKSVIKDRSRMANLHFEVELLQGEILDYRPPKKMVDPVAPDSDEFP